MGLGKSLFAASALTIAALGVGVAAAQAGVVVKSSGPSAGQYPVGKKLDDSASITLKAGDSVTVLTSAGTRVISGAGTHRVGAAGANKRSAFAVLTRQRSGNRVRTGAVRAGASTAVARNPNLWNLDVSQGGRMCLTDSNLVNLWRPQTEGQATYIFRSAPSDFHVHVTFDDGVSQASLSSDALPLTATSAYSVSGPDGTSAQLVEFVILDSAPEDPESMAAVLAENGCTAQLDLLAERLMASE